MSAKKNTNSSKSTQKNEINNTTKKQNNENNLAKGNKKVDTQKMQGKNNSKKSENKSGNTVKNSSVNKSNASKKQSENKPKKQTTNKSSTSKKQTANKSNTTKKPEVKKENSSNKKNVSNVTKVNTNTKPNKSENNVEKKSEIKKENSALNNSKLIVKEDAKIAKSKVNDAQTLENKKRKILAVTINISAVLLILLIFSTIFAILFAGKNTIARGVSIKNIDVSNLTYEEARAKLEEAFKVELNVNIDLKYKDYSYTLKSEDIGLKYDIDDVLNQAYQIGRGSSIIRNNYSLIATAFTNKNIDFKFDYNEEELNKIVDYISTDVPDLMMQYSYYIEENDLIINSGVDGIQVNKDELKEEILNNVANRNVKDLIQNYKNSTIDIPYSSVKADKIDLEKIHNEIYSEPKNAYYTEATETTDFAIFPDSDGIDFAISMEEAKNIISQEGNTEYVIPLNRKKADITINDIGIEAFPYKISTFPTKYDASNLNRSENLRIAASKINGTVLMPGEKFSFNAVVGERTIAEGYKDAAIYSDGQVVDGLAGGICQISSTLYNAVLLANLQIDERYNHSFTTSYVQAGRDATVVYGVKDFKFTNNREYPIKIEAIVANGVATFNIYGIKQKNEYSVKIIPVTTETTPYKVQTITDASLPAGKIKIVQAGASGCKVTTYKEVSLNGVVISKEVISNDVYKVMTRIVRKGPSSAPASATPVPAPATTPAPAQ